MLTGDAERCIREHSPRLIYASPCFGDPMGRVWSLERRRELVELCASHQVPIVEDDSYGDVAFDTRSGIPPLLSLGTETGADVIYIGGFSKTVAPALRAGWVAGTSRLIGLLDRGRQKGDAPGLRDCRLLLELLRNFPLEAHFLRLGAACGERAGQMSRLLQGGRWRHVKWSEPQGGIFIWLELPETLDAEALLRCASAKGVSFARGASFFAGEPERSTARLNFAGVHGERMKEGMDRLADALEEFTARLG